MSLLLLPFRKQNAIFCGGLYHLRHCCPARNAECNECGKTGHFARFCRSKSPNISAALLPEHYIASVVGALACLQAAVADIEIQGLPARASLDTGASDSYVDSEVAKKRWVRMQRSKLKRHCSVNSFF